MPKKKYSLTEDHRAQLKPWAEKWIANALSCKAMDDEDKAAMVEAVNGMYHAAKLPPPKNVVFVPSPLVLCLAAPIAAGVWHQRKTRVATLAATHEATHAATLAATRAATRAASSAATYTATHAATRDATSVATRAATQAATHDATRAATRAASSAATYTATHDATRVATHDATRIAAHDATHAATHAATHDATRDATYEATHAATYDATRDATSVAAYAATHAATSAAPYDATCVATLAATHEATHEATHAATQAATHDATRAATYTATHDATRVATHDATHAATSAATLAATHAATHDATSAATSAATYAATLDATVRFLLGCVGNYYNLWDGGNQWSGWVSYLSFFRHVADLRLPEYEVFQWYEMAAIHGGPRCSTPDFVMVSDRPEFIKRDAENRPHCEDGPFCRWRDGFALYYWHGVKMPAKYYLSPFSAQDVIKEPNSQVRAALIAKMGLERFIVDLNPKVLETLGEYELVIIPDADLGNITALKMRCPTTQAVYVHAVHPRCETVEQALKWKRGDNLHKQPFFRHGDVYGIRVDASPNNSGSYRANLIWER